MPVVGMYNTRRFCLSAAVGMNSACPRAPELQLCMASIGTYLASFLTWINC